MEDNYLNKKERADTYKGKRPYAWALIGRVNRFLDKI
jgi:hypothetical protein